MTDTESPDVVIAEGHFKPHVLWKLSIFNLSTQEFEAAGLHRVDYNLVADELSNGNGDSVMLTGLIVLVSVIDEDNKIINSISLSLFKPASTVEEAIAYGEEFLLLQHENENVLSMLIVNAAGGDRDCEEEERLCRSAAFLNYQARRKAILAATVSAIVGIPIACIAAGPACLLCFGGLEAAALVAEAISLSAENDR